ncbi:hypothetical protein ACOZ38_37245 [Sphaerisporangium viridialbum]|uniref:hypothetical protein n=1 Tax=Sphaerisporangium viridialbum TaxID=46189 RepID=UPI003C731B9F
MRQQVNSCHGMTAFNDVSVRHDESISHETGCAMNQLMPLIPLIAIMPLLAFWAWMVRDMAANPTLHPQARYTWMAILLFLNIFGAGLYYATEYRKR